MYLSYQEVFNAVVEAIGEETTGLNGKVIADIADSVICKLQDLGATIAPEEDEVEADLEDRNSDTEVE